MPWWAGPNAGKMHRMGLSFHEHNQFSLPVVFRAGCARTFDYPTCFLKLRLVHSDLVCSLLSHKDEVPILDHSRLPRLGFVFSPDPVPSLYFVFFLWDCANASLNGDYDFLVALAALDGHIADGFDTDGASSVQKRSIRRKPQVTSRPKPTAERCTWSMENIGAVRQQLRQGYLRREVDQMVSDRQR